MTSGLLSLASSSVVVAGAIQTQFLPIGGIGESRGISVANDGTMLVYNDSTGGWISNTATIPGNGPGTYQWQPLMSASNAPSAWLQAPTPYLCWHASTYSVATVANNSNLIYMMYNLYGGNANYGVLFKSTDRATTWSLTNYPINANNGNGTIAGQDPGQFNATTVIDPNNNNNVWASDGAQLRVSLDGGSTWNAANPNGSANPGYSMCFDAVTANRLIVGINGSGVYVSTNANLGASATWTLITGSTTSPGQGLMGSDGTYYITNSGTSAGFSTVDRISTSNVRTQIFNGTQCFGMGIDPNNPGRLFLTPTNNAGVITNITAANTTTPSWTSQASVNWTNVDAPAVDTFGNVNGGLQAIIDPWKTTSSTTINLSGLSAGGSTGNITVSANIPNITVGRQLRCTNTGTLSNYFIFTVGSYSGTTLSGTIISSAQGGYLGGPIGGTATASAWTITAERAYLCFDGVSYVEGFSSTTQNVFACKFGIEGSGIQDVVWPVGGNPAMTAQDRPVFQVQVNPWGLTGSTGGAVKGYSPQAGPLQDSFINCSVTDPTFWINNSWAGTWFSSTSAKTGTFTKYTNQPTPSGLGGPVAISIPSIALVADEAGSLYYSQNANVIGATWTAVPSPAPTSGWTMGAQFDAATTICADRTTITTPYVFYALNSNGNVYKVSVPTSGTPTATNLGQIGTTTPPIQKCKLDSVVGQAGHLFFCAGASTPAQSYTALFADSPLGGGARLWFYNGTTWNVLTTTQEIIMFGINGAIVPGGSGYPTIYAAGWCGGGSYGIYQCINFNPASLGSETWTKVATYGGAFNLGTPTAMAADPNQYNRFITGSQGSGAAIFQSPNLTNAWFS